MDAPPAPDGLVVLSFDIGIKNLAGCLFEIPRGAGALTTRVHKWHVWALAEKEERIPNLHELTHRLIDVLDELVHELEGMGIKKIDQVLLENQPSRLNGAMKSIQMLIYSYFQLRAHWDGLVDKTQMVSAAHKIQGHTHVITADSKNKKGYALNKWLGVQYAEKYIADCPTLSALFKGHKKRDDLADAMLQGIAWARKHNFQIEAAVAAS